jgi:uncharacterized repeat protein (TIGR03847 family)
VSVHELDVVDRFVVGTVGMPGSRAFYFQVSAPKVLLSFKCEKMQVAALVEALREMMTQLPPPPVAREVPVAGGAGAAWAALDLPVLPEFAVGSIGIGYESTADRLVVVFDEIEVGGAEADGKARFFLTRAQAALFVERANEIVHAGRPMCPLCAASINPDGYSCVCFN